jgi:hypothetical protein
LIREKSIVLVSIQVFGLNFALFGKVLKNPLAANVAVPLCDSLHLLWLACTPPSLAAVIKGII